MIQENRLILPEWSQQSSVWVGWPSSAELWGSYLQPARIEIRDLVAELSSRVPVRLVVSGTEAAIAATEMCKKTCEIIELPMGDIWLRDTGPIYAHQSEGLVGLRFRFNGWGEKYLIDGDEDMAQSMLAIDQLSMVSHTEVLEGGSIEYDGNGCVLTTRQCLLNSNRNEGLGETEIESLFARVFESDRVVWLNEGLTSDHTDGHVDNLARFIGKGRVVCQRPSGDDDPNRDVLRAVEQDLLAAGFDVVTIPSPGRISDAEGNVMPASHVNFVFANGKIIMPRFEDIFSHLARKELQDAMLNIEVVSLPANNILTGGGAFHCMTLQVPSLDSVV